jgi:lysophospholipase L1-like esterase
MNFIPASNRLATKQGRRIARRVVAEFVEVTEKRWLRPFIADAPCGPDGFATSGGGAIREGSVDPTGTRSQWVIWVLAFWLVAVGAAFGQDATKAGSTGSRVNSAVVPVPGGGDKWRARHQAMNDRAKQGNVDLIYIGDSIVASWKWDGEPVWNHYYAKRSGMVLGISGDRTEQVLWRLQNGNIDGISPKLAVVMIGQNNGPFNTGEEIGAGVAAIVQTLREKLPTTKILVLAIFQRGEKPTPERAVLRKANEILSKLADGQQVFFLDINHLFVRPDGTIPASLMPDFEHPNEEGHRVWAAATEAKIAELMGDSPTQEMPTSGSAKASASPGR